MLSKIPNQLSTRYQVSDSSNSNQIYIQVPHYLHDIKYLILLLQLGIYTNLSWTKYLPRGFLWLDSLYNCCYTPSYTCRWVSNLWLPNSLLLGWHEGKQQKETEDWRDTTRVCTSWFLVRILLILPVHHKRCVSWS